MASDVDIINFALARLGDEATVASISPPEGSAQAEHAARFYPVARDSMLESHPWRFATRRAVLAPLSQNAWNWNLVYAAPTGMLRLLSVIPMAAPDEAQSCEYELASDASSVPIIYTNQEAASARYVARVTDSTQFSPLFTDALAWLLASYLAGPVIKGDTGMKVGQACYATFRIAEAQAKTSDANQRHVEPRHQPDWMRARGGMPMVDRFGDFRGR